MEGEKMESAVDPPKVEVVIVLQSDYGSYLGVNSNGDLNLYNGSNPVPHDLHPYTFYQAWSMKSNNSVTFQSEQFTGNYLTGHGDSRVDGQVPVSPPDARSCWVKRKYLELFPKSERPGSGGWVVLQNMGVFNESSYFVVMPGAGDTQGQMTFRLSSDMNDVKDHGAFHIHDPRDPTVMPPPPHF